MGGQLDDRWLWTGGTERRRLGQDEAARDGERTAATRLGTVPGEWWAMITRIFLISPD